MSTLGISEFEDSMWDEFFQVDQIVPNDGLECFSSNDHFPWHDNLRNTIFEVNCNSSHSEAASISRCAQLCRKQGGCSSLHDKCNSISDADSWSCKRSAVFPFSSESDLMDETSSVAFDDCHAFKISSEDSQGGDCNFPENGTNVGVRRTSEDNQSETAYQESSFNFFENNSTNFFSGVCPDIQSFEDVEMMFRSPDSAFDVGVDKDELSWLSPDNDGGGCRFEFSYPKPSTDANMSEDRDSSKSYLAEGSAMASVPNKFKYSSYTLEKSDPDIPFVIIPTIADSKDGFIPRDKRVGIIDTLHPSSHLQQQQKQALGLQNHISNAPLEKSHLPDQTSASQQPSAVKYEGTDLSLLLQMEFCDESNRLQSIDRFHDLPSSTTSLAGIEKNQYSVNKSLKDAKIMGQAYESDSRSVGKQVHLCGDKFEDTIDTDGVNLVNPSTLGSSIEQKSKTRHMDEISPEAATFCQLQLVMEWMDFRTRLSIRDGLYRLARGAEQRHNHSDPRCSSVVGKTSSGLLIAEETNEYTDFMNMEAATNPIDRSIAHLLFHRQSDSCAIPCHDS